MKRTISQLIIIIAFLAWARPSFAAQATLNLASGNSDYQIGDIIKISINVKTGGNALQLIRAKINYPADLLAAQDFQLGNLFAKETSDKILDCGVIYVGGYSDSKPITTDGTLGYVTFKVIKSGQATLSLTDGSMEITPLAENVFQGKSELALNLNPNKAIAVQSPIATNNNINENAANNLNEAQPPKITLFDIQAEAAKRSWLEFYLVLIGIIVFFIGLFVYLVAKKK